MTAPHTDSDDRAILAAHDKRLLNAGWSLDAAVRAFKRCARREHLDRLLNAALGYHDEWVAGLERKAGREVGAFGRVTEEVYPPQIRPPAVEAWEDGPRPQNDFGRGAP